MQRKRLILFTAMMLFAVNIIAQEKTNKLLPDEIGGNFSLTRQDQTTRKSPGPGAGPGLTLLAKYNLSPKMFFTIGAGYVSATDKILGTDVNKVSLFPMGELRFGFYPVTLGNLSPYINAGIMGFKSVYNSTAGGTTTKIDMGYDPAFTGGLGLSYNINNKLSINAGGDIAYAFMSTTGAGQSKPIFWSAKAGLSYALGKSGKKASGEEMEYPVDNNDLAIDDLFKMNTEDQSSSDNSNQSKTETNKDEADALALLFGETSNTEKSSFDSNTSDNVTTGTTSKAEKSKYSRPTNANELIARVEQLQAEIERNRQEVEELKNKVTENERLLAQVSGKVAGQYAGIEQGYSNRVSDNNFKATYKQALQYFYKRNYKETIRIMRNLLVSNPDHRLASNCQYWIGESLNAMGDYKSAMNAFNNVLTYRKSYKLDDALLMAGLCSLKLGDVNSAREKFQTLVSKYPDSEYAPKAMRFLGRL